MIFLFEPRIAIKCEGGDISRKIFHKKSTTSFKSDRQEQIHRKQLPWIVKKIPQKIIYTHLIKSSFEPQSRADFLLRNE